MNEPDETPEQHDDDRQLWRTEAEQHELGEAPAEQPAAIIEARAAEVCICDLSVADADGNFPPCGE